MNEDRDPYERMLAALADDAPAQWDAEQGASVSADSPRFAPLHELSRIAGFHRSLQRTPETASEKAPVSWGELMLLERIASGERSEVWRAWDPALHRDVALKLMRAGTLSGEVAEAALLDEARAAARVTHPNVVVAHGVARHGDRVGLWMELVRGRSLEAIVRQGGALSPADAAQLGADMAAALAAVHAAGVLHRDIKPANVLRDASGRWVLADFGLGFSADRRERPTHASAGTPMYMAPEIFAGQSPTTATDVYSLGLLLWFALTGTDAFAAASVEDRARLATSGTAPSMRQASPGVPRSLAAIMERAIAREPSSRWSSAAELERALRAWNPNATPRTRNTLRWAAATAVVAVAVALAWTFNSNRRGELASVPSASTPVVAPDASGAGTYAIEATMVRRAGTGTEPLLDGARVAPGDRLSLQLRASRKVYAYVLNEDERGERYLLFPQPSFDQANPVPADAALLLPGTVGGRENAWTVTSRGGREHFLIVVSPSPVAELEAELAHLPAPRAGHAVAYAPINDAVVERLRGVGGLAALPAKPSAERQRASAFDHFRSLASRESGVSGVWVRQVVLENPLK